MKLNALLLFWILAILTACKGQKTTHLDYNPISVSIGDTVSALSSNVWIVFQASNGDYWFGSDRDGAYRFDEKSIVHFSTKDGLSSNRIRDMQEDSHGSMYFSTLEGINKFDGHTFSKLTVMPGIFTGNPWILQPDDLWFYTLGKNGEKGPYRYDGKNLYRLEFPKHYLEDEYFSKFTNTSWSPYEVYTIYKDSKGIMWFGTSNFGLCRFDGRSLSWLYEDHLTNTPEGGSFGIRSVLEDTKGKYWICNTGYRYSIAPDSIKENGKVLIKYEREKGVADIKTADGRDHIYFMSAIVDDLGNIWMASYDQGVWKYDGKESTHYPVTDKGKTITLFSIYKDKKGGLWLGSHENGPYKFNGETFEKFKPFEKG